MADLLKKKNIFIHDGVCVESVNSKLKVLTGMKVKKKNLRTSAKFQL